MFIIILFYILYNIINYMYTNKYYYYIIITAIF